MSVLKQKKSKNIGFTPISVEHIFIDNHDAKHCDLRDFMRSTSSADQLGLLKNIVAKQDGCVDAVVTKFLATVYFYSPPKHPIKCYLTKCVTKPNNIQELFTKSLSEEITSQLKLHKYSQYLATVPKIVLCIENFPVGAAALKLIDLQLAEYLSKCLTCCTEVLENPSLTATKKHEIFCLEHSCLRLLVHIIQKLSVAEYHHKWSSLFAMFTDNIEQLIDNDDLPMDTKCLCGILYLYMLILQNGNDRVTAVNTILSGAAEPYLQSPTGRLSLYSALATSVPAECLQHEVNGDVAVVVLTNKLLELSESSGLSQALELGIARALVQISASLGAAADGRLARVLHAAFFTRLDCTADCVRHLAETGLTNVLRHYVHLDNNNNDGSGVSTFLRTLASLPPESRARWKASRAAAGVLPLQTVMTLVCTAPDAIRALDMPHLHTTAKSILRTVLSRHSRQCDTDELFCTWLLPAVETRSSAALDVIFKLQPELAAKLDEYNLTARKGVSEGLGQLSSKHLYMAAVHADENVRIQALTQVVESSKSAPFSADDVTFLLHFLRHNMNAHSTNFRQLVIGLIHKALERAARSQTASLPAAIRALCVGALGGPAARRRVSAALLAHAHSACTQVEWSESEVEILLRALEDSYGSTRDAALAVLQDCPPELLRKDTYSTSLDLERVLEQATSLKPPDSVAAAYKLRLILSKMPERILKGYEHVWGEAAYALCWRLLEAARGRAGGPAFAPLHCLAALLHAVGDATLTSQEPWRALAEDTISTCEAVTAAGGAVVGSASPEGLLPPGLHAAHGVVISQDGRPLTAQMVLLCAWRSVKEASLLLGWLGGVLSVRDPGIVQRVGDCLVGVLRGCQHRGAFEQAAAGLAALLDRTSSNEVSHLPKQYLTELLAHVSSAGETEIQTTRRSAGLPFLIQTLLAAEPALVARTMAALLTVASSAASSARRALALNVLCALYRSSALESVTQEQLCAGLPLAVRGIDAHTWSERTASCLLFSALCVRTFGVVRSRTSLDVRNTLPAHVFFARHPLMYDLMLSKLEEALHSDAETMHPSVYPVLLLLSRLRPSGDGTVSSLKVSPMEALVQRWCGGAGLTGRQLAAAAAAALLPPTRYYEDIKRTFTILSYQTISTNYCHGLLLRLSRVLHNIPIVEDKQSNTNERPNINSEEAYTGHVEDSRCEGVSSRCEGVSSRSEGVSSRCEGVSSRCEGVSSRCEGVSTRNEGVDIWGSTWILMQPCYVLIHEYVAVLRMMMDRFPQSVTKSLRTALSYRLHELVFSPEWLPVSPGRSTALATCYKILVHITDGNGRVDLLMKGLEHECYEVELEALNYILGLHKIDQNQVLTTLQSLRQYVNVLSRGYYEGKYLECRRKCLMLLTLQTDTQRYVINNMDATDKQIVDKLLNIIENAHISEKHVFLRSLLNFTSRKLDTEFDKNSIINVTKAAFACCLEENADDVKEVIMDYLENNIKRAWDLNLEKLKDEDKFEYKATLLALLVLLLEDDDEEIRLRASDVTVSLARDVTRTHTAAALAPLGDVTHRVLPSFSGEMLRSFVDASDDSRGFLVMIALLQFKSDASGTEVLSEEFRVFEHSDRSDIYLEDAMWTDACADKIIAKYPQQIDLIEYTSSVITDQKYAKALNALCKDNLRIFYEIVNGKRFRKKDGVNPKIERFVNKLRLRQLNCT